MDKSSREKFYDQVIKSRSQAPRRLVIAKRKRLALRLFLIALICLGFVYQFTTFFTPLSEKINSDSGKNEWSMYQKNFGRTGSDTTHPAPTSGSLKWTFKADDAIYSSIGAADGIVYFGSKDGKIYALHQSDGSKVWEFQTESWITSSPIIANQTLFLGSNDSNLYALNAKTGEELWRFSAVYKVGSSPAFADNTVFFGGDDYHVYAVDARDGSLKWKYPTGNRIISSPVVANGLLYIGSTDGYLYSLHVKTGRLFLRFNTSASIIGSPAMAGQTVFVSNMKGNVFAIDGFERNWPLEEIIRPRWMVLFIHGDIPKAPPAPSGYLWNMRFNEPIFASPVVTSEALFVASHSALVAVNRPERSERWRFKPAGNLTNSPAISGPHVILGDSNGDIVALSKTTGDVAWMIQTGEKISSAPSVINGTVYVGTEAGTLYAID